MIFLFLFIGLFILATVMYSAALVRSANRRAVYEQVIKTDTGLARPDDGDTAGAVSTIRVGDQFASDKQREYSHCKAFSRPSASSAARRVSIWSVNNPLRRVA